MNVGNVSQVRNLLVFYVWVSFFISRVKKIGGSMSPWIILASEASIPFHAAGFIRGVNAARGTSSCEACCQILIWMLTADAVEQAVFIPPWRIPITHEFKFD